MKHVPKILITDFQEYLVEEFKPNLFVTLVLSYGIGRLAGRERVKRFDQWVDKKLRGSGYLKESYCTRTEFYAFPEKWADHPHFHLLVKTDWNLRHKYCSTAYEVWQRLCDEGSCKASVILRSDRERVVRYCLKEQWNAMNYENWIHNYVFHPSR